jgi:DNA-binding transcriptional ArsR family regulator
VKTNGDLAAFQALGDPTRHAIFQRLKEGEVAVGELAADLPVSRPAVSQHLRVLKAAGLVSERREGTRRVYRVEPQGVWALRQSIDRMWQDALEAFRLAVEREEREEQ